MKKLKVIFSLCLISLLCLPLANVHAAEEKFVTVTGDNVTSQQDVNGSAIHAGNNVTTNHTISGVNMLFGNNVNLKGSSDYTILAGNNVHAIGKVNRDGIIAGNAIILDDSFEIDRDLFIFGNTVTISGKLNRDVTIYASSVIIENATIANDAKIYASNIEIKENATIMGVMSYNKDANLTKSDKATIGDTALLNELSHTYTISERVWSTVLSYLGMLLVFLALAFIVPKLFKRIDSKAKKLGIFDFLTTMGLGAMSIVVVPVAIILLLSLVFGVPLALLLIAFFVIVAALSTIFSGYLLGTILWNRTFKQEENTLLSGLVGITILSLVSLIPIVNNIVMIISLLVGIGTVLLLFKKDLV